MTQTLVRPSTVKAKKIRPTMHAQVKPGAAFIKRAYDLRLNQDDWEHLLDVLATHPPFAGMPFSSSPTDNECLEVARLRGMGATMSDLSKSTGLNYSQLVKATDKVRRWFAVA